MKYRKSPLQIQKLHSVAWLKSGASKAQFPKRFKINRSELADFEQSIKGKIVYPWSEGYDKDRKEFNNVYEAYPLMIVYVICYEDVRLTLAYANEQSIHLVVRAGGHSLADYSVCDGIVLDVSQLNNIYVEPMTKVAIVEAGCTFEKMIPAIEFYNLHVPTGGCPTVAVAGFMQGGGYSLTSRNYGMNCDCVLDVTVMLANGQIVTANKIKNKDLFWAVRGGTGGNFGVLLKITYQLFELGTMYGIKIKWTINTEGASQALYTIQENYLKSNAYSNLGIETVLVTDTDGIMKVIFCGAWIGTKSAFEKAIAPLKKIAGAEIGQIIEGKYSAVNNGLLEGIPNVPPGIKAYSRSIYFERSLSQNDWKDILAYFSTAPNKYTTVDMEGYGGKINSIKPGTNSFIHRNVTMDFFCDVFFDKETNDQKKNEIWLEDFFKFLAKYGNGHSYQNYPNRNQKDFRFAYWGNYYDQLTWIKYKYDRANFFYFEQSIGLPLEHSKKSKQIKLLSNTPIKYEKL